MKKIHTKCPCPVCWLIGRADGHFEIAGLNSDSGQVQSAFVVKKQFRFQEHCYRALLKMETHLAPLRNSAADLLIEYKTTPVPDIPKPMVVTRPNLSFPKNGSLEQARQARAAAAAAAAEQARCQSALQTREANLNRLRKIRQELGKIMGQISAEENQLHQQLEADAVRVQNQLGSYAHGVVHAPVVKAQITEFSVAEAFAGYQARHRAQNEEILSVMNHEEDCYEE